VDWRRWPELIILLVGNLQEATENNAFAFHRAWKKLFGGAYKFLSELGPCGWTQGLFFIKNTGIHKKITRQNPSRPLSPFSVTSCPDTH